MKTINIILLLMLLVMPNSLLAQEPEEEYLVHVVVLYDGNHDGVEEGVGKDIVVEARKGRNIVAVSLTNENSDAMFVLPYGLYYFSAWVPSTRFLFRWVCNYWGFVEIASWEQIKEKYFVINCYERFFLQFPFVMGG